jgi:hypothetical protein
MFFSDFAGGWEESNGITPNDTAGNARKR